MSTPLLESFADAFARKLDYFWKNTIRWFAKRPVLTLTTVIIIGTTLLPAVTIAVLAPIAILFNYIGIFGSTSGLTTVYSIMFKGFLLAAFLTGLLTISFLILTCVSVMHSYNVMSFTFKKRI